MKNITIIIVLALFFSACNNRNDKYLKLINEENELLTYQLEITYGKINYLNKNNPNKYILWKHRGEYLMDLVNNIQNNLGDDDILKSSCEKLDKVSKWFVCDGFNHDFDKYKQIKDSSFLELDFDIDNKIESALFLNKFLTLSDIYMNRILFETNIRDFRMTNIYAEVNLNKQSFKVDEKIQANIFFSVAETTVRPIIKLENGLVADTFDMRGKGIYILSNHKKGVHKIKGYILWKHDYREYADTFSFEKEYTVY